MSLPNTIVYYRGTISDRFSTPTARNSPSIPAPNGYHPPIRTDRNRRIPNLLRRESRGLGIRLVSACSGLSEDAMPVSPRATMRNTLTHLQVILDDLMVSRDGVCVIECRRDRHSHDWKSSHDSIPDVDIIRPLTY